MDYTESSQIVTLEARISDLEAVVAEVLARNERVECDKAWEVSSFRMYSVAAITYLITSGVFIALGVETPFLSAIIPMLGFVLSTLTLPLLKEWWRKKVWDGQ